MVTGIRRQAVSRMNGVFLELARRMLIFDFLMYTMIGLISPNSGRVLLRKRNLVFFFDLKYISTASTLI